LIRNIKNKTINVSAVRYANKVNGSAYGRPYLAAKKPVLHIQTKSHGVKRVLKVRFFIKNTKNSFT
jgi:hypothetical protein